ncbi:hypothetical protein ACS0TY_007591 [Phlomoides rotata]
MGFLVLFVLAMFGVSNATEYKVGDDSGWALNGNVDYKNWTSVKAFHVDDILIFEYDPQNHNVLLVNKSSFHLCDTVAPIATFTTGHDSFVIRGPGHYFFICGFVGHCQAGQKIDIRVLKVPKHVGPASIPTSSPIQTRNESSVPSVSFAGPMAPSPSISSGQSHMSYSGLLSIGLGLFVTIVWAFNEFL